MNSKDVVEAFAGVEISEATLNAVVGITVIDAALLDNVAGGHDGSGGHGYFNTVSGECFFGISCNPVHWYI